MIAVLKITGIPAYEFLHIPELNDPERETWYYIENNIAVKQSGAIKSFVYNYHS